MRPGTHFAGVLIAGALVFASAAFALPAVPPNASLTVSPNPAPRNQTVTFDGTQSTGDGVGGTITTYEWDLDGNGTFEVNTGATPTASRSYSTLQTITVRLRVTDNENDMDVDTESLQVVNATPTASFIFEPSTPAVNEQLTFSSTSSDPDGTITVANHRWDFDDDGQFDDATGDTVTHSFTTPGTKPVSLQVTDANGAVAVADRDVEVQADPPTATFTFSPPTPLSAETVSFDGSASSAPAGETVTAMSWDLDGDGEFDDATGATASTSFATPGSHTVGLRVDSSGGDFDITTAVVPVGNRDPRASFIFLPEAPQTGDVVRLTSTSSDPDGPIVEQSWDLDGDGEFDDASGATAERAFETAGPHTVGLRVRDASGATHTTSTSVDVAAKELPLMSPFPIVRLTGELKPSGRTEITRLSIRAPSGAVVAVSCRHKSCPFDQRTRTVKKTRVGFPGLETVLDPGVVIRVFVTDEGVIGKYTRFKIRHDKAPDRNDKCLLGGKRDPISCPRQQ